MAGVPFAFATATTSIPLSQLDADFNTGLTIGNTTVGLGNTVTTLGNVTLTNVNIISGTVPAATSIVNGSSNVSISSSGGNVNIVTAGTISTFPQANGTVMVSGNMPAFSASQSANQAIGISTYTKIQFNTKDFDTNSCYDNATNYRFTPNVAGYYQINAQVRDASGAATGSLYCAIYKNGTNYKQSIGPVGGNGLSTNVAVIIFCNGSTDYIEVYANQSSAAGMNIGSGINTYFNGSLVRAA